MPLTNSITKYGWPDFRLAAIQHLGNIRMVHHGQSLSLGFEPGDDLFAVHARFDDLQRDIATYGSDLFGHVDHAETTFANLLQQFVAANALAKRLSDMASVLGRCHVEQAVLLLMGS